MRGWVDASFGIRVSHPCWLRLFNGTRYCNGFSWVSARTNSANCGTHAADWARSLDELTPTISLCRPCFFDPRCPSACSENTRSLSDNR